MIEHAQQTVSGRGRRRRLWAPGACLAGVLCAGQVLAREYVIRQIADPNVQNSGAVISETGLIAWYGYRQTEREVEGNIYIYRDGTMQKLTKGEHSFGIHPAVHRDSVVWEGRIAREIEVLVPATPQEGAEPGDEPPPPTVERRIVNDEWGICRWDGGEVYPVSFSLEGEWSDGDGAEKEDEEEERPSRVRRTSRAGVLSVVSPAIWGEITAWQRARGWPCGWEITWARLDEKPVQITTNCYYDMGPQIYENRIVWYGWDGNDFEIMMYDIESGETTQITDTNYDDVSPVIWGDTIAWEGFPSVDADIFIWRNGEIKRISDNPEEDIRPRVWENYVVWQGLRGENYQIFLYDGETTRQITDTNYDNVDPDIRDGYICWAGYVDNWDAEIFVQHVDDVLPIRLTDNDYEDTNPRTAGGRVVWEAKRDGLPLIYVAEPR